MRKSGEYFKDIREERATLIGAPQLHCSDQSLHAQIAQDASLRDTSWNPQGVDGVIAGCSYCPAEEVHGSGHETFRSKETAIPTSQKLAMCD